MLYDASADDKLSCLARRFLAGVIHHSPALTLLFSPTFNCFRRMAGAFINTQAQWGIDDRFASFRVKNSSAGGTYMEVRPVSSAANVYLVMAGVVAAGIDGVEKKMELPTMKKKLTSEEFVQSVMAAKMAAAEGKAEDTKTEAGPSFATSLEEAIKNLETDDVIREALGDKFITWFTFLKRKEVEQFKEHKPAESNAEEFATERAAYGEFL